jgi:hypothetical protein
VAHLTSTPRRTAAVRPQAARVAAIRSTDVAIKPGPRAGLSARLDRVPGVYNLRKFFAGRFHRS